MLLIVNSMMMLKLYFPNFQHLFKNNFLKISNFDIKFLLNISEIKSKQIVTQKT